MYDYNCKHVNHKCQCVEYFNSDDNVQSIMIRRDAIVFDTDDVGSRGNSKSYNIGAIVSYLKEYEEQLNKEEM